MGLERENLNNIMTVGGRTFIVPTFQLSYKWNTDDWDYLFEDLKRIYNHQDKFHFIGVFVLQKINDDQLRIIDGQQRLTTISLLLLALAKYIREENIGEMNLTNGIKNFLYIETVENQKRTRLILTKQENNNLNYENLITSSFGNGIIQQIDNNFVKTVNYFYDLILNFFNELDENVDKKYVCNRIKRINLQKITIFTNYT